jgi:hypothetical protein
VIRRWLPWLIVAAAAALLVVPIDPELVERLYSTRAYLLWQSRLTPVSNRVPFALFDLLLAAAVVTAAWITIAAVRGFRRGGRWRAIGIAASRALTVTAVLYLWFLASWGLNYRRVPLLERLELEHPAPTSAAVAQMGQQAVERLNALHAAAHAWPASDPWRDARLRDAYQRTLRYLSSGPPALPGRLKQSVVGPYFRWASVDGMIDPFALEVLANPDLLPFERPFVACHEWAHLGGYADESEASFVGWLTCVRGGEAAQYSAWLFLYWEINGLVGAAERAPLAAALAPGPRADIEAMVDRVRRGQLPRLRAISWTAYDQYLKANRVEEGVRSYDLAITLLARARFMDGWVPVLRQPVGGRHTSGQPQSTMRPAAARLRRSPIAGPSPSSAGSARARISSTPAASSSRSAA